MNFDAMLKRYKHFYIKLEKEIIKNAAKPEQTY